MNSDRTANANLAPRCQHTKMNGSPCAAPARRGRNYCVFHDGAHSKQPDYALRMIEDAMSLQYALLQVMRLLTDKAVDTKRAALMLYALQIASSNLKRLHEETQEITNSADMAQEKSLMKELLEVLQIPETEAERMAEEMAVERERENPPTDTYTIKACAGAHSEGLRTAWWRSDRVGVPRLGRAPSLRMTDVRIAELRNCGIGG